MRGATVCRGRIAAAQISMTHYLQASSLVGISSSTGPARPSLHETGTALSPVQPAGNVPANNVVA